MPEPVVLTTTRLRLRPWLESDREPFATLNADPVVMEFFPATLSHVESNAAFDRIMQGFAERGWGLWAVEVSDAKNAGSTSSCGSSRTEFIGFIGLAIPRFEAHFTPCVEIGWRLTRSAWGFGYATEGAQSVIDFGFHQLKLSEIMSFTAKVNERSQRVMRRLGMTHDPQDDFIHPALPVGHCLSEHVLYRLANKQFTSNSHELDVWDR